MSLEGRLRELALPEVMQLLGLSRKSGTLRLRAQLQGRAAFITLAQGAVINAASWRLADYAEDESAPGLATSASASRAVEACVLELLTWRDGDFRFEPADAAPASTSVRLAVELLLVESAQRAEGWERIADRIAHARVVPTFVDVEPQQLPLLRLVAQEWEILTRVDGRRDLTELATVLQREVLDVGQIVHGLIGAGLLTLREATFAPRRNPTPPIVAAIQPADPSRDLWIPSSDGDHDANGDFTDDDDLLFDPIEVGVQTADGMPRRRTTPRGNAVIVKTEAISVTHVAEISIENPQAVAPDNSHQNAVAPTVAETSLQRGEASWPLPGMDATALCSQGDDAARRGDLAGALTFWSAALRSEASLVDADRVREAIALAARLHALLHPAARRS